MNISFIFVYFDCFVQNSDCLLHLILFLLMVFYNQIDMRKSYISPQLFTDDIKVSAVMLQSDVDMDMDEEEE